MCRLLAVGVLQLNPESQIGPCWGRFGQPELYVKNMRYKGTCNKSVAMSANKLMKDWAVRLAHPDSHHEGKDY